MGGQHLVSRKQPWILGASGHRREKRSPSLRAVPVLHNARCSSAPPNTSASPSMSLQEEQLAPGLGGKVSKRPSEAYLSTLFSWVPSTTRGSRIGCYTSTMTVDDGDEEAHTPALRVFIIEDVCFLKAYVLKRW